MRTTSDGRRMAASEMRFMYVPGASIGVVARLRGAVDKGALRRAIDALARLYPALGSRVVFDAEHAPWLTTVGATAPSLDVRARTSDDDWRTTIQAENRIPTPFGSGPLARFILLSSSEVSDLVVFCHHSIADGRAVADLVKDALLYAADPSKIPSSRPELFQLTSAVMPPSIVPPGLAAKLKMGLMKIMVRKLNRAWEKEETAFDHEDFADLFHAYTDRFEHAFDVLEYTKEETQALVDACRGHGITVNSAIVAAVIDARERAGRLRGGTLTSVAVDVRPYLTRTATSSFGMFGSGTVFDPSHDPARPFWDYAKAVHAKVEAGRANPTALLAGIAAMERLAPSLVQSTPFVGLGRYVSPGANRYEKISRFVANEKSAARTLGARMFANYPGVITTNLGRRVYPTSYGAFELEKMYFPAGSSGFADVCPGIVTVNDRLTITLNYSRSKEQRSREEAWALRVRETTDASLRAAITDSSGLPHERTRSSAGTP